MAEKLVNRDGTVPIFFREQNDTAEDLACRYIAELTEVHFRDLFESDASRTAWLKEKLWLQRETLRKSVKSWEAELQASEIDPFMRAETWYIIRNLREIKALPLPRLRKLDGQPLACNYVRGYALCQFLADEIEVIGAGR